MRRLEKWEVLTLQMLGSEIIDHKAIEDIPKGLYEQLSSTAVMVERAGGSLKSRQAIAIIINGYRQGLGSAV